MTIPARGRLRRRAALTALAAAFTFQGLALLPQPAGAQSVPSEPLQVYVTPTPQGDILRFVQQLADADGSGLKLSVIESSQGLDANALLFAGDVDATLIQHVPYFDSWIAAHPDAADTLVNAATLLVNIFGLYSVNFDSVAEIPDDTQILVPNEQTNLPRALFILQNEGLLELDHAQSDGSAQAVAIDEQNIVSNPKNLRFAPTETGLRARSLPDVQASFINGDIALTHGIDPSNALSLEDPENNPYANVLTTRRELLDDPRIQLLVDYLTGEEVRSFIEDSYQGFIVPAQERLTTAE